MSEREPSQGDGRATPAETKTTDLPETEGAGRSAEAAAGAFRHYSGKVSRQGFIFLGGTLFSVACGYVFKIYVSRTIGADGLGLYALGMRVVDLCAMLANLGLSMSLARHVALYSSTDQKGRIRSLLLAALAFSVGAAVALGALVALARDWLATTVFNEPALVAYLPIVALLIPVATANELLGQYLRGHQEVSRRTLINHFLQFPVKIAVTVGLFALGLGVTGYLVGELVSQAAAVLLLAFFAVRFTPTADPDAAPGLDRKVRTFASSMIGLNALGFVSSKADVVILGILLDAEQVGIYSIAVTTGAFVPTLLRALNSIFGPIISGLHARGDRELLERLFQTSTKWCLGLTFPLVAVICCFAAELMGIFGPDFRAGGLALALVAVGQLINVGTGSVGNLLTMSGHQNWELKTLGVTAVLTLGLDVLLIPVWGLEGAALALALALSVANLIRLYLVRRHLGLRAYRRRALWLAVPMTVSAVVVVAVRQLWPGGPDLVALFVALAAAYLAFLAAAYPVLDDDDRMLLRAAIEKVRSRLGR